MKHKIFSILFILTFSIFLSSCGYFESKEDQKSWVKTSLEEDIKKDPMYNNITIKDISLVRESASKFSGWVEFTDGTNSEKSILTVTVDNDTKMYSCEPPKSLLLKNSMPTF